MQEILQKGRLVWRLIQDPRVPGWVKVGIPLLIALYFFSPIDFIPDIILGLGQLDDLGVIILGLSLIIRLSPRQVVDEHKYALGIDLPFDASVRERQGGEGTIEGEYRVMPPNSEVGVPGEQSITGKLRQKEE
jgi:uncharacterized membrane protein YkvA (DUF1232 family)